MSTTSAAGRLSVGESGGACDCGFRGRTVAHVEHGALGLTAGRANAFGDSRSGVRIDIADQYRCAGNSQRLGDGRTDATT